MTMQAIRLVPIVIFALALAAAARATTLERMSVEAMTKAAGVVAEARCTGSASEWQGGEIWTITRFAVIEAWKGNPGRQVTVRLPGGRVGHITSLVPGVPRFSAGEEVVLFLESPRAGAYAVTAWSEGTFRIRRDTPHRAAWAIEDAGGMLLRAGRRGAENTEGVRMSLDSLRARVQRARQATGQ
jgi:hypothetical protein